MAVDGAANRRWSCSRPPPSHPCLGGGRRVADRCGALSASAWSVIVSPVTAGTQDRCDHPAGQKGRRGPQSGHPSVFDPAVYIAAGRALFPQLVQARRGIATRS